jgi:hypothetical protein
LPQPTPAVQVPLLLSNLRLNMMRNAYQVDRYQELYAQLHQVKLCGSETPFPTCSLPRASACAAVRSGSAPRSIPFPVVGALEVQTRTTSLM